MGDVTAVMMDVITEKSGHTITPLAVSVCITPAAPSPLPLPYPVVASSIEGIGDAPMRTKINGALIGTVGSVLKTCHGNEPGTMKEVLSLNTSGPVFIIMGAPVVLCELGMMGITGSPCMSNKAPTPGAGGSASGAGGSGGAGSGGGGDGGGGGDASGPQGPSNGGGAGGGGSNTGASGPGASSGAAGEHQCQDGHPVDVVTGYVVDEATDIALPGAIPLIWRRIYSSSRRGDSGASLGPGWAHGFEQHVVEEERTITLREAEGRSVWFAKVKPGESTFHRRERLTLTRDVDGRTYRVYSHATRRTQVFAGDAAGAPARLRSIRDAWDNAITLEHDGARLARIVDTAGREVRVAWREGRIVRLEVRADGRLEQWVDYAYSASRCLTRVVDALGGAEEFEYDRFHRMTAAVIKTGARFQYEYEANTGRCKKTWGPKGLYAIELHTDSAARTTHVDGEEPRIITWNDQGLATREALPDGTILEESAYDEDCLLVASVNGAGEGEQYWYDERGNRVRTVDALGNATSIEFEDDLPRRRVAPDGLVTEYSYDEKGSLTAVATPSGQRYSQTYDDHGRVTGLLDASGLIRGFEYDRQHNLVAEIDARGARTAYTHDAMGRPVSCTDALGRVTRVSYDRLGRRLAVRLPDGTTTQSTYDARGKVLRSTDQLGQVTAYEYSGMGALSRLIQPDGKAWSFKHTSKERVQEIKNPRGEAYTFVYDEVGRAISETTFDGRTLEYGYSPSGHLDRIRTPDGTTRGFSYDRLGKMILDTTPDGTVTCRRDRFGRLVGATLEEAGQRIVTQLRLDALGRVVREGQGDRWIEYAYDAWGRRSERKLPGGATRYAYDAADALIGVEHEGQALVFERDALGRETRRGDARGLLSIQQAYDAMDRLIEQRVTAAAPGGGIPAILAQRQYGYDAAGRVKRIDDGRWGASSYVYDKAGRLLDATRAGHREAFRYDPAGALIAWLEGLDPPKSAGWEIAPGNTLKQTETAKYAHDKRGRRTSKLDLKARDPRGEGAVTRYTWDCRDRLREVELPDGTRVRMAYDAFGRRIRKEIVATSGAVERTVEFLWDGDTVAADFDSARGNRCFVHAPGTQIPLLQAEQGKVFTYVTDHLGTAKELLDPAGQIAWSAAHSAWGEVTASHLDPAVAASQKRRIESPFRALGQIADEETGLHSTRYRFFDPEVGRWCSPDPLGLRGGNDLFGFDGSPTVEVDPLGLAGKKGAPHGSGAPAPAPPPAGTPPPNMSPPGAGRQGAFNEAKRQSGIPTSQQPSAIRPNTDRRGDTQPGHQYDFAVPTPGGGTKTVTIRDDAGGHDFGPGNAQNRGPHFNDEAGNHYDY